MRIKVVILNYNGERILRECLPSVIEACRRAQTPSGLTVIDNRSSDRSADVLRHDFSAVDVWVSPQNKVLCTYNEYIKRIDEPVVIFLNNDIRVDPDFIDALAKPFEKGEDVFMVTPRCMSFDGSRYEGGRCRSCIRGGLFWSASVFEGYENQIGNPGFTMAAGFGAFDRKKLLELGGYDDLYLPGRLEDNDICFRAWRRGWKCLYEPSSVVYHMGASAFNEKYGADKTLTLAQRNSFLFFWKNIRDGRYLLEHVLMLIPRLLHAALTGKWALVRGFGEALPRLGGALERRGRERGTPRKMKDREIFNLVK